jgi:TonB family protein
MPESVREVFKRPHNPPLVTMALRADGTVESVVIVTSSGVPEVDAMVRRVIESVVPFAPFSPLLAREFDVVEIRRTWTFDTALRLN